MQCSTILLHWWLQEKKPHKRIKCSVCGIKEAFYASVWLLSPQVTKITTAPTDWHMYNVMQERLLDCVLQSPGPYPLTANIWVRRASLLLLMHPLALYIGTWGEWGAPLKTLLLCPMLSWLLLYATAKLFNLVKLIKPSVNQMLTMCTPIVNQVLTKLVNHVFSSVKYLVLAFWASLPSYPYLSFTQA